MRMKFLTLRFKRFEISSVKSVTLVVVSSRLTIFDTSAVPSWMTSSDDDCCDSATSSFSKNLFSRMSCAVSVVSDGSKTRDKISFSESSFKHERRIVDWVDIFTRFAQYSSYEKIKLKDCKLLLFGGILRVYQILIR